MPNNVTPGFLNSKTPSLISRLRETRFQDFDACCYLTMTMRRFPDGKDSSPAGHSSLELLMNLHRAKALQANPALRAFVDMQGEI